MGIIAHCPSGHRIKVKDHLAGKKGICPTCGAKFRIPDASAPIGYGAAGPLVSAMRPPAAERDVAVFPGGAPVAAIVSLDPSAAAGLPEVLLVAEWSTSASPAAEDQPMSRPPVDPDPIADVVLYAEADEPITASGEDDLCWWYVAVPGGHPSEAMRDAEMRGWLASGQVTGREVVWRSDWPDWRPIGEVFPERVVE